MHPGAMRIIKLHKRWADRHMVLRQAFTLALLAGFQFFLDNIGVQTLDRAGIEVLLATMVVMAAIWQAAGLAIARLHMILKDIELER
ncbi:hypothetical protein MTX26_15855 [Bradyrhizobium sp. ISRA443]|uniref:hypothetical protein n=1 Tax=unclassified Bradyrhizobium TaxID=2631580 RepID=UPI00247A5A52|nr:MULTISPECIES: hypothetical protein [unclassified Bradyrhizobium]WGS02202.1 hypothetical protein MTX23_15865 [Bradyrhizobium sp. ISRA436]WGS09087.1 hypothetical protein MTX18_15855 [Bradyrhizobium sp. ISRA437]WGS15976.1 hypothetical protein MTX26_15855 [Bradyrhizobium sp. ISRA443]